MRRSTPQRRSAPKRGKGISPANPAQKDAVKDRSCLVCAQSGVHPAHLIDRSLCDDMGDARAVVPLCPRCHRDYDDGGLSILEFLEPRFRSELAFAVERFGLLRTLERVTNERYEPVRRAA